MLEPEISDSLKTVRKTEHLQIFLIEAELLCGLSHLWRYFHVSELCPPETEPTKLLNVFVQLEVLKLVTPAENNVSNFSQ